MSGRDELAAACRVVRTGPLFSMTTKEAEDVADTILALGYRRLDPQALKEAEDAVDFEPANAVEAHLQQVLRAVIA